MPNVIDDSKEAQDERYNPSTARDLRARENDAFNDIANNYDQTADDTQENANIAAAREGEATSPAVSAGWQSNVTGKSAKPSKPKFFSKAFWTKGNLKKKGPLGLIISLVLIGGIGGTITLLPGVGIVHFKETLMNNMDSQIAAVDKRGVYVMASKVQGGAGICTNVINIRCKFSSLSDRRIAKFEKNGFTITKADSKIPGRSAITAMSFTDSGGKVHTIKNPGEMRTLLASNASARSSFRATYNSRFENFAGKAFSSVMRKIPGVNKTQKIPDTKDKAKINEAIKSASQGKPIDASGQAVNDNDSDEARKAKENNSKYAGDLGDEAKAVAESGQKAATSMFKGAARGVGVLGVADSLCVVKNTMVAVEVGAKVIRAKQLVNFAMVFLTAADAIKAGDATPNQVEAVGNILTATDEREFIEYTDEDGKVSKQENPYYKKSAFDSVGYKSVAYGDTPNHNFTSVQYLVGGTPAIGALSGINDALAVSDGTCDVVTNPFVRAASGIAGIVLAIGSFGATLAISVGGSVAVSAALPYLQSLLIDMLAGVAVDDSTVGPSAGDATVAGTGYMLGLMAQANGMQPANGSAANVAYNQTNTTAVDADIAHQTQLATATPLDIYNPYSAIGKITGALYPSLAATVSNGSVNLSKLASLPSTALRSLTAGQSVSAADKTTGCNDPSYQAIGITAGGMCQVSFYMTDKELSMDPMENIDWMINNGQIDETSGEAKGEYKKFLENCVERMENNDIVPFGSKGETITDGAECLDQSKNVMPNISHFRVYTMDKNISDGIDYETTDELAAEEVNQSEVIVPSGEWSSPAPAYTKTVRGFGYPVGYPSGVKNSDGSWGHNGVDLSGTRKPEDALAACDGTVTHTRAPKLNLVERTDANTIVVDCGEGITVGYHHAALDSGLSDGARVTSGQKIGRSDLSGNTTGYHIHLTVRVNGNFTNPVPFFKEKGISLLQ